MQEVYVGWQFAQIFYRNDRWRWFHWLWKSSKTKTKACAADYDDDDDNLMLDKRLIHDILPQQGGGQEPIEGDALVSSTTGARSCPAT